MAISFKSVKIMQWDVHGDNKNDPICDFVSASPEWQEFLRWREGIPKCDWNLVIIDQVLISDKK